MQEFSFSTRIFFGDRALDRLQRVRNRKVMVVTDDFLVTSGTVNHVVSHLSDCEVTVFSGVTPDPTIEVVAAGVKCLKDCQAEVMMAVGGGSVIDAAKAIRSFANSQELATTEIVECFAIPTTSGTGSEVTEYAVISDSAQGVKYPLANRDMRPPTAILDPLLVVSAPPNVTADSGMDVLAHAIEAYVSKGANDFSDALAEKSVELAVEFLPLAYKDGHDLLAREKMHNASCMAGLAFNSAGLGLCHGISHAIGAKLHISHGRANAMVLPHIVQFNASGINEHSVISAKKYRSLAKLLDMPAPDTLSGVHQLVCMLNSLNKTLDIPASLKVAKIDRSLISSVESDIIDAALADMTTDSNPIAPTPEDIKNLLDRISGY